MKLRTRTLPPVNKSRVVQESPRRFGIALGCALLLHAMLGIGLLVPSFRGPPPTGAKQTTPIKVAFANSEVVVQSPTRHERPPKPELHLVEPSGQQPETLEAPRIDAMLVKADFSPTFKIRFHPGADSLEPALNFPERKPKHKSQQASRATTGTPSKPGPRKTITSTAPRPLRAPAPVYPASARAQNHEGTVVLIVFIDSNGKIKSIRRAEPSMDSSLDQAAENAVRRWRFAPATKNGVAVPSSLRIPIAFQLNLKSP